ncbi:MAG TPA: hypothetical protein VNG13_01840 [Mycobacteriales bacterium]|nr:hypothetical protein [Mycobacteriales bacterium]
MTGPATRVVYTDLDGTMVGPGGCFFRDLDRGLTLEPARALVEALDAGIQIVLVSGRTREQLIEAARIFGADGYIGELGSVLGWDRGRHSELLRGAMPADLDGPPAAAITAAGVTDRLLERHPGRLEYHAPWHLAHECDVMLRGLIDVAAAEAWLAEIGFGWLRLRDNGVLPSSRSHGLVPEARPPHVYHLMPDGLSKGLAVARDLARRGYLPQDAIAIGDSASDLTMAPYVRQLHLVANGHRQPHMAALIRGLPNVTLANAAVGLGWAAAVRAAVTGPG